MTLCRQMTAEHSNDCTDNVHILCRRTAQLTWPPKKPGPRVVIVKGETKVWGSSRHYRRGSEKIRGIWDHLAATGKLPPTASRRAPIPSMIHDPDIQDRCRRVIKTLPKRWSAREFRRKITDDLRSDGTITAKRTIATRTASFWISQLDMFLVCSKKGIYKDAHDRPDVVQARVCYCDDFVTRILPQITTHEGEDMCVVVPPANLPAGNREMVEVMQDECIFAVNEDRGQYYTSDESEAAFHKTKGAAFMVSAFICSCHGMFEIPACDMAAFLAKNHDVDFKWSKKMYEREGVFSAATYIEPGKADSKDGYWTGELMAEQTIEVTRIFEWLHDPAKFKGVWVFDNSTGHGVFSPDALKVTSHLNLTPGGVNAPGAAARSDVGKKKLKKGGIPPMKDGWFDSVWLVSGIDDDNCEYENTATGETQMDHPHPGLEHACHPDAETGLIGRVIQPMHIREDGRFKGMRQVLLERGVNISGLTLRCTKKDRDQRSGTAADDEGALGSQGGGCKAGDHCCIANKLASQPDFVAQKCLIQEVLESRGHEFKMLPKCHPELNSIEQVWASLKTDTRMHCSYDMAGLRARVPLAIRALSVATVRRYFRRQHRFCSMYNQEGGVEMMPWKIREFVMKKYSQHRGVPQNVLALIDVDLAAQEVSLQERVHAKGIKKEKLERVVVLRTQMKSHRDRLAFLAYLEQLSSYWPMDSDPYYEGGL